MTLFEAKRRGLCLGTSDPVSSSTVSSAADEVGGVLATDFGRGRRSMNTSGIRPDGEGFAVVRDVLAPVFVRLGDAAAAASR
jgi:hypothetical protein